MKINNKKLRIVFIKQPLMKKILTSLFKKPPKQLTICAHHDPKKITTIDPKIHPVPYAKDYCKSCDENICHVCSQEHVTNHCNVDCGINTQLGNGILRDFNYGRVAKVDLNGLKCICGKLLGPTATICAACGMASCSEACHAMWQKAGNCIFSQNFYSIPLGFNMRSILFENIYKLKRAKVIDWAIANRSSQTMVCCYVNGEEDYVLLQRGYRNYGNPNNQLIQRMEILPSSIDYQIQYDRLCNCQCQNCINLGHHSVHNCQNKCAYFEFQFIKNQSLKPQTHKQCTCTCDFCMSGTILSTHRVIDCLPYCKRSSMARQYQS